jgi:hypothetical protein
MTARILVGVAVLAAALIPWTATATATGGGEPSTSAIDIVYAEMDGSGEFNVWGTVRCTVIGDLTLDVEFEQTSSGGTGAGASNSHTCLAPGQTIKWVIDAIGVRLMVEDEVTITAFAAGATVATKTETHILHWGLPSEAGNGDG